MFKTIKKLLPKNKFARSIGVLVGGTAGSQIILIAASPILTRLYSPEDFGLFAVFTGILAVLVVLSSLRYELAIPLPEEDEEAASTTLLGLIVVLLISVIIGIIVLLFNKNIALWLESPSLSNYLYLLPFGVLLAGTYRVLMYWTIRKEKFKAITQTKLMQALTMIFVQIAAFKTGLFALIFGHISGQGIGGSKLGLPLIKSQEFRGITVKKIFQVAIRYKKFPLYSAPSGLLNSVSVQLPPILFAGLFSPTVAGLYALSNRALISPIRIISSAVANVFVSAAPKAQRENNLSDFVYNIYDKLANVAIAPALILILIAPELFKLVFGLEWMEAGVYAQILAPWFCLIFITTPLSSVFSVLEKQSDELIFQVSLLLGRSGSIVIGYHLGDVMLTLILFGSTSFICWLGFLFWIMHKTGNKISKLIYSMFNAILIAVLLVIPLILVTIMYPESLILKLGGLIFSLVLIASRYYKLLKK